ncbi:hypothetical protein JHK82_018967 [Glycine max]|nr:hypothetical protein JHK82_018967 [Glycine max]
MLFSFSFHSYVYQIRNSVKLKRIMQTILSLGNVFNHGTIRGLTVGFRLDSLLKLTDTRATNNNMTLMHYLCKEREGNQLDLPWFQCTDQWISVYSWLETLDKD